jgi:hypothetical protein
VFRRQHFCRDIAWATAGVVNIERVEKLDKAALLKWRKPQGGRQKADGLAGQAAGKAQRDVEPELEQAVERQEHGGTSRALLVLQADMEFARPVGDDQLTPIGIRVVGERLADGVEIERCKSIETGRRRLQDQHAGRGLGKPHCRIGPDG